MARMTRRRFLAGSAAMAAGAFVLSTPSHRVLGANDDIRVAILGLNGQGGSHLMTHRDIAGARIVALCDPDKAVLERAVKHLATVPADPDNPEKSKEKARKLQEKHANVATYTDLRRVYDRKDVDAVVIAAPNHWHSLATIWAVQAGKDVYVEKPLSHDIFEGRQVVEAAAKYNRIVYVGTQSRSDEGLAEAFEWLKAGNLGKLLRARGFCYKPRGSIGKTEGPQPIPGTVDYDLWCGPAPKDPLRRKKLHYEWHWFWATGNADIGNQGIHEMDKCRWGIGATIVKRAMGFGGRFGYEDDAETPNTETVFLETDTVPIIFEVRGLPVRKATAEEKNPAMDAYGKAGVRVGEVFDFEGGYFAGGWAVDSKGEKVKQFKRDGGAKHRDNFLKALRSRKPEDNPAQAIEGHRSAICFHVGNISYRLGKETKREEVAEMFKTDKVAQECWERFQTHVSANEADPSKWQPTVGPWLTFDPQAEKFTGAFADKANVLTKGTRDGKYREPFVVPEKV